MGLVYNPQSELHSPTSCRVDALNWGSYCKPNFPELTILGHPSCILQVCSSSLFVNFQIPLLMYRMKFCVKGKLRLFLMDEQPSPCS